MHEKIEVINISPHGTETVKNGDSEERDLSENRKYTIEEAVESFGLGQFQFQIICICGVLEVCSKLSDCNIYLYSLS